MKNKILVTIFALPAIIMGALFADSNAMATATKYTCLDGSQVNTMSECAEFKADNLKTDKTIADTMKNIVNTLIGVIGFLAVLVVIYGGFLYTTSAGDASKVTKAKNTIMYGVIGIVVALMAYAIVNFVLSSIINGSTTTS